MRNKLILNTTDLKRFVLVKTEAGSGGNVQLKTLFVSSAVKPN